MEKILQLHPPSPPKFDFERVRRRKKESPEKKGQMNLFTSRSAQVLSLPTGLTTFEEALLLDERGDTRAEQLYRRAIEDGDSSADAFCNLGIILSRSGETAKAFDSFTKSLELDPRHFESHYNLGNLYFESGDLRLARMHYELAREIDPDFPNLYFNLGLVLASMNTLQPAIDSFLKYQKLVPGEEGQKADDVLASLRLSLDAKR